MSTEPGADLLCLQYEALGFSSKEIARFIRHVYQVPKCVRAVSVAGEVEISLVRVQTALFCLEALLKLATMLEATVASLKMLSAIH